MEKTLTGRLFLRLFFPTLFIQLFNTLSTLLDFIIPGQFFGETALSAITLTTPILMLVTAFSDTISFSGSSLFSRELGSGNLAGARRYFTASMIMGIVIGSAITGLGLLFLNPLVLLLGANEEIFLAAKKVTAGTLFYFPVMSLYLSAGYFVRNDGHPRLALTADIVFMAFNLILDIVLTGFSPFGIMGSVAASIIAAMLALIVLCAVMFMKESSLHFSGAVCLSDFTDILREGYGLAFQSIYEGFTAGFFNNAIMRTIGADGLVLYSVVSYTQEVLRNISFSIRDTVQPMLGTFMGEKRPDAIRRTMKTALKMGLIVSAVMFIVLELLPPCTYRVFGITRSTQLQGACSLVKVFAPVTPALCFSCVYIGYCQFLELPRLSFLMLLIQQLVLKLPLGLLGLHLGNMKGMVIALVLSEYLTALLCLLMSRIFAAKQEPSLTAFLLLPKCLKKHFLRECLNHESQVMTVLNELREYLYDNSVSKETVSRVILALEELCINICRHNAESSGIVELCVDVDSLEIIAQLRDTCTPFDPVSFLETHPRSPGYGLLLANHSANVLEYVPTVGLNRTILHFDLSSSQLNAISSRSSAVLQ